MTVALLSAHGMGAGYKGGLVLDKLDFYLNAGEVVALLGPNGCGKTTLLRCLLGLQRPIHGDVRLLGEVLDKIPVARRAQYMAYVPQYHRVAFGYTVLDIVLMGRLAGRGMFARARKHDFVLARAALARVNMEGFAERPYTELSGGQRQLVLIARALCQEAEILILDEPMNNLDYGNQLRLLEILRELNAAHTVLFTTHHPEHALHIASRAVLMKSGRVLTEGVPQVVLNEVSIAELYDLPRERVAHFSETTCRFTSS